MKNVPELHTVGHAPVRWQQKPAHMARDHQEAQEPRGVGNEHAQPATAPATGPGGQPAEETAPRELRPLCCPGAGGESSPDSAKDRGVVAAGPGPGAISRRRPTGRRRTQLSAGLGALPHPVGITLKTPAFRPDSDMNCTVGPIRRKGQLQTPMSRFYKYFTKHTGNSRMKLWVLHSNLFRLENHRL